MPPQEPPKAKAKPDSNREAVSVVVRFIEAFNNRDADVLAGLLAEDLINHTFFGHRPIRPEAVGRAVKGMWETFPDWHETIDEIIPAEDGTIVVRHTGRGTQVKSYMGREPDGKQIAAHHFTILKIKGGKIIDYRATFPFTRPWDETITSARDLQEARAEQGGFEPDEQQWTAALREVAEGDLKVSGLAARRREVPETRSRCQSLLQENMRRCINNAQPGSLYCSIHQQAGALGGFGAD
jgi:predicted ester cyclase